MTLPKLNRRLTLETPEKVPDGAGGYTINWNVLGTLWAAVDGRTGRERAEGTGPLSTVAYRITVRAAPVGNAERPKPEQRFRDGARIFWIRAVIEDVDTTQYLTCLAEEEIVT